VADSKLCRKDLGEGRWCVVLLLGTRSSDALVKPPRTADLAPERECLHELGLNLRPCLRAPLLVLDFAQDTVDPKPRVPEALVGVALFVHFVFGPHGVSGSDPSCRSSAAQVEQRMGRPIGKLHATAKTRTWRAFSSGNDNGLPTPRRRASCSAARGCRACDYATARVRGVSRSQRRCSRKKRNVDRSLPLRPARVPRRGAVTPGTCLGERPQKSAKHPPVLEPLNQQGDTHDTRYEKEPDTTE